VKARAERTSPIDASGVRALVERAGLISSGFAVPGAPGLYAIGQSKITAEDVKQSYAERRRGDFGIAKRHSSLTTLPRR